MTSTDVFRTRMHQSRRDWQDVRVQSAALDWSQGGQAHGPAAWNTAVACALSVCRRCRLPLLPGEIVLVRQGDDPPTTRALLCRGCGLDTGLLLECSS